MHLFGEAEDVSFAKLRSQMGEELSNQFHTYYFANDVVKVGLWSINEICFQLKVLLVSKREYRLLFNPLWFSLIYCYKHCCITFYCSLQKIVNGTGTTLSFFPAVFCRDNL